MARARLQAITLTARSGLTTTAGLTMITTTRAIACDGCANVARPSRATATATVAPTSWTPEPEQKFDWELIDNADGMSTLALTIYPFHYNAETGDALYYQDFVFETQVITSTVTVSDLSTDRRAYNPGDPVQISLGLRNTGAPQDVFVLTTIHQEAWGKARAGLPVYSFHGLVGDGAAELSLGQSGVAPGDYIVEVEPRGGENNSLDRADSSIRLGISGAYISGLTAAPAAPAPRRAGERRPDPGEHRHRADHRLCQHRDRARCRDHGDHGIHRRCGHGRRGARHLPGPWLRPQRGACDQSGGVEVQVQEGEHRQYLPFMRR